MSFEDKVLFKNLWECKKISARRLLKELPNMNILTTIVKILEVD